MNIAVKKFNNNVGFSESTLLWAIICSILLHVLLVAIIPNIKFDTHKKPEVLEIQLAKPEPPPVVTPQPEPPKPEPVKPEPIKPKIEPKPIVKPAPVIVHKEEPTPIQPNSPPQPNPPEVITAPPKVEAPQVVAPPPPTKPSVSPEEVSQAHEGYGTTLFNAISKFKKYPRIALSRGWEGKVIVELSLDGNGKLKSKKIIQNSGYEVLDQQALEMVDKALPFPEPPEALRGSGFTIRVPIPFKLEQP